MNGFRHKSEQTDERTDEGENNGPNPINRGPTKAIGGYCVKNTGS